MRRTSWIAYSAAALALLSAVAALIMNVQPTSNIRPSWLKARILDYQPYAFGAAIGIALVLFVVQIAQGWLGQPSFRKGTIREITDVLVRMLPGEARKNRVTVFKRVMGWQAYLIGYWRLCPRFWHASKKRKRDALKRIDFAADYLIPYVRSSGAPRRNSVSVFRISDYENECEGMAGRAWYRGFITRPDLPRLKPGHRSSIQEKTLEEILARHPNDRLRRYVEATRVRDTRQLRSFHTFAQHFMGSTIDTGTGRPWGVVLLDSDETVCPFDPADSTGGTVGEVFRMHAASLGHILR